MISNPEAARLCRSFGVRPKRVRVVQNGVYRIFSASGREFALKRMPYPPAQIRWIDQTLQRMRRKGKLRFAWRNPRDRTGKRLFVQLNPDSPPFILIPWYKGSWPSPSSEAHMRECGALLATFHKLGSQIRIPQNGKQNMLGTWPSYLREERSKLTARILKAKRNGDRRPMYRMLRRHGGELLQMAARSMRALHHSRYFERCRSIRPVLCHGDFGPTNVIRTAKGPVLIDFETLRWDLAAYDLYRGIYNFCQNGGWKFSLARAFLDGYRRVRPLTRADMDLVKALLRFPRGVCKLVEQYEYATEKDKRMFERELPRTLSYERRRDAFLKNLDAYARTLK